VRSSFRSHSELISVYAGAYLRIDISHFSLDANIGFGAVAQNEVLPTHDDPYIRHLIVWSLGEYFFICIML
jgi:hypothetical protein